MITTLSPASQMMLRHKNFFKNRNILFAGDLQDALAAHWNAKNVYAHLTMYQRYQQLADKMGERVVFSLMPDVAFVENIDTLIYFWPKSKREAQFQLTYLRALLQDNVDIFIVGENRSGVRSCEKYLNDEGEIRKVDTARRCSLYHFKENKKPIFDLTSWWQRYFLSDNTCIMTLPGVFSAEHLDEGSRLLLESLHDMPQIIYGNILDVGSGAGVLSACIGKIKPEVQLTLSDVNAAALVASQATLEANQLHGHIIASNIFSNIEESYDLIMSNPPFHEGIQTDYTASESLIREAKKHLKPGGHLCLVANAFLPYAILLDHFFGMHRVLKQTSKFKVYLTQHEHKIESEK